VKVIKRPKTTTRPLTPDRRVLALVGNSQVGLWAVRSLGRAGLKVFAVCTSQHGLAAHSRCAAGAWKLEVPAHSPAFPEQILALARRLGVGSIMTIAESYHIALIRSRELFEPDIHVFSPPADAFQKATDKDYMHALCLRLGVPVARGTTLDRLMSGSADCDLRFPLVLRARRQNDPAIAVPWKAAYANDRRELEKLHGKVEAIASNVLVQEYHPGVEDHLQVLMHRGEPFMVGEYIGEHHMPLAGGVTVQRVSCRHPRLIDDAVRLFQAVGWDGIGGVQFHYDTRTSRHIFLEINPRFIGGLPTIIMAGFDAPFLSWQSRFEPHRMRKSCYQVGVRTRILGGDANWMFGMIRGDQLPPGQERLGKLQTVGRFLWNFGPWTRDDTFWLADIAPALVDWRQMIRRLGQQHVDIMGTAAPREATR
jgi:predicted ATP-grasp superfamily ATP-dependent carboligase